MQFQILAHDPRTEPYPITVEPFQQLGNARHRARLHCQRHRIATTVVDLFDRTTVATYSPCPATP